MALYKCIIVIIVIIIIIIIIIIVFIIKKGQKKAINNLEGIMSKSACSYLINFHRGILTWKLINNLTVHLGCSSVTSCSKVCVVDT